MDEYIDSFDIEEIDNSLWMDHDNGSITFIDPDNFTEPFQLDIF